MSVNDYYGNKQGTTILEIYNEPVDGSPKIVHRSLRDADAYDSWHLSYYFKEILEYKRLLLKGNFELLEVPRPEKNLLLYLIFASNKELKSICEIGSTLFEMIDGFEAIVKCITDEAINIPVLDVEKLKYVGIELSEVLRLASKVIHPNFDIKLHETVPEFNEHVDVLYDRSVTNYAFDNVDELVDFVQHGKVALLNTYFSLGKTFQSGRLGKAVTYFSLEEFVNKINEPFYHLFGQRAPNHGRDMSLGNPVVEGFFYYGNQVVLDNFIKMSDNDQSIQKFFKEKELRPKNAKDLL